MSSPETPEAKFPASRAYTIWTGKRPVIRPLIKPESPEAESAETEPVSSAPSHAFTVWIKTPGPAAAVSDAATDDEPEEEAVAIPASRAFSLWANPDRVPASTAPETAQDSDPADVSTSPADSPPAAPSTTPPEPQPGGGGGLLGVGVALLVALIFGLLGYGFREDLKKLQQSNEELRTELGVAEERNRELNNALRKELRAADEELTGKVAGLTKDREFLQKSLADAEKKLGDRVGALKTEKDQLVEDLAAAEKKLSGQVAKLTAEKTALQKKLVDADKVFVDQIDDLNAGKKDLQMRLMAEKTRIEGLLKNVQTLQGEMAKDKAANKQEFSNLRSQLDSAKNSIDRLIKALTGLGKPAEG